MFDFLFLSSPLSSFVLSLSVFSSVLLFSYSFTLPSVLFSYSPSFSLLPSPPREPRGTAFSSDEVPVVESQHVQQCGCSMAIVLCHMAPTHRTCMVITTFYLILETARSACGCRDQLGLRSDFKPYPLHLVQSLVTNYSTSCVKGGQRCLPQMVLLRIKIQWQI